MSRYIFSFLLSRKVFIMPHRLHVIILRVVSSLVLGYRDTTMDLCIPELSPRYLGLRLYRRKKKMDNFIGSIIVQCHDLT
jgi:hypothetical protein